MITPQEFYKTSKLDLDTIQESLAFADAYAMELLKPILPVLTELGKAKTKHPEYPECMFRQVSIMNEEAGEVTKAVLHFHYENGSIEDVKKELIQTAAMCLRMLENLQ